MLDIYAYSNKNECTLIASLLIVQSLRKIRSNKVQKNQGHVREVGQVAYIRQTQRLVWFKEKKPMAYSISLCLENTDF